MNSDDLAITTDLEKSSQSVSALRLSADDSIYFQMIAYILNSQHRKDKPQRQASYIGLLFPEYKYYHYQLQFCNGMFEFLTFDLNKYALKSA